MNKYQASVFGGKAGIALIAGGVAVAGAAAFVIYKKISGNKPAPKNTPAAKKSASNTPAAKKSANNKPAVKKTAKNTPAPKNNPAPKKKKKSKKRKKGR